MAFLQSAPPRQPIFRAPPVVMWLVALLVALHVARVIQPQQRADLLVLQYGLVPLRYDHVFLALHPQSWWERVLPFFSYMGLHGDITHLAINSLFLLAFGPIVARRFGTPLFLVFFAVCGVAGAGLYVAMNWGTAEPVIGASGAISGLMAAAMRLLPTQIPWAMPGETPLAPLWSRQVVTFSLIWAAVNFIGGVTGFGLVGESGLIAWQAHLGGYIAGLLLADVFDWLRPRPLARSLGEG